MPWGVYQEYLTGRAQGTVRGGPKKWKGFENKLHRNLYQSFGLANRVRFCNLDYKILMPCDKIPFREHLIYQP